MKQVDLHLRAAPSYPAEDGSANVAKMQIANCLVLLGILWFYVACASIGTLWHSADDTKIERSMQMAE